MGRSRSQSSLYGQGSAAGMAAILKLCKFGAFTTSLGSRFQALIVQSKMRLGIYIGKKLVIGRITGSSMHYLRRYIEKKINIS